MRFTEATSAGLFDCGCIILTVPREGVEAFVVRPCTIRCRNYRTIMDLQAEHPEKPVSVEMIDP